MNGHWNSLEEMEYNAELMAWKDIFGVDAEDNIATPRYKLAIKQFKELFAIKVQISLCNLILS